MTAVSLVTDRLKMAKVYATNSADTSFTSRVDVSGTPSGVGIFPVLGNIARFVFYGTGNENTTFDARIYGLEQVGSHSLWVPLATLSLTLSTAVGLSGGEIIDTERYADTIVVSKAITAYDLNSPADNTRASFKLAMGMHMFGALDFDMTGATNANALLGWH